MHDTFLLNKISHSLKEICKENNIKRIKQFSLVVNHDSHVNEENLLEHLNSFKVYLITQVYIT